MTSINSKKYRPDIDGLRALAISSVVLFHAFPDLIPGGFIGVDIFFVISGYLISTIIFTELDAGTFSFRDFYARRIRRIFPALWIVLLFSLPFGYFLLFSEEYKDLGSQVVAGIFFYSNFYYLKAFTDYFSPLSEQQPLLHLWSLGIEEQFYIFWPVFTYAFWRFKNIFFRIILLLTILSFGLNLWTIQRDPMETFYLPTTRAWELLLGAILAWLHLYQKEWLEGKIRNPFLKRWIPDAKAFLGIALILLGITVISKASPFPGYLALLPSLGAFLLISAGPNTWINRRILSNKISVFIGLISFPLYLWHWPLLSFANITASGIPPLPIRIVAVLLSILLAYMTMSLVERRIRFRPGKQITIGLIASMLFLGALTYVITLPKVSEHRGIRYESLKEKVLYQLANQKSCKDDFRASMSPDICYYGTLEKEPTVVLFGDSHAESYYPGLAKYFKTTLNTNLMLLAMHECPPFVKMINLTGRSPKVCSENQNIIKYIEQNPNIKTVLISGRGPIRISGKGFGKIESHVSQDLHFASDPSITDKAEIFKLSLRATVQPLVEAGKEVVLIADNPELGFPVSECGAQRPLQLFIADFRDPCAVSRKDFEDRNREYHKILNEVANEFPKGSIKIWESWKGFCDEKWCWGKKDGFVLYLDDDHLSLQGSIWIAEQYNPVIVDRN